MKYPIAVIQKQPTLNVYWTVTDFCNFSCNYCPPSLHNGIHHQGKKPGFPTDEEIDQFLEDLVTKHANGRNVRVQLSGGEPTLHPRLPHVIRKLKEHNVQIGITTNGSRSENFWKEILPIDAVTISIQPEFTNIDRINRISKFILSTETTLEFNLSCDPNNWDKMIELYEGLDEQLKEYVNPKILNYLSVSSKDKDKHRKTYEYEPYQKEWMRLIGNKKKLNTGVQIDSSSSVVLFSDGSSLPLIGNGNITKMNLYSWNKMIGWKCNVGSESISIQSDGNVYAGVCKMKLLGRITSFKLENEPIICAVQYCVCPADLRVNKRMVIKPT